MLKLSYRSGGKELFKCSTLPCSPTLGPQHQSSAVSAVRAHAADPTLVPPASPTACAKRWILGRKPLAEHHAAKLDLAMTALGGEVARDTDLLGASRPVRPVASAPANLARASPGRRRPGSDRGQSEGPAVARERALARDGSPPGRAGQREGAGHRPRRHPDQRPQREKEAGADVQTRLRLPPPMRIPRPRSTATPASKRMTADLAL